MKQTRIGVLSLGLFLLLLAVPAMSSPTGGCSLPPSETFYLTGVAPDLDLETTAPSSSTPTSIDSPSLTKTGGNLYKPLGTWYYETGGGGSNCSLNSLSALNVWLGLRNSDDQGTKFDVKAEVFFGASATPFSTGEVLCVSGLVRNPDSAEHVSINFSPFSGIVFSGTPPLSVKISARIGTGATCTGHANATGLRLYYDAVSRPSEFDATFGPACPTGPTLDGETRYVPCPCTTQSIDC
ncbi:MAG TPA: hypothetical protein VKG01_04010 [Thermoanaerobaculia bacterium]|nr:hypothetical protein [Thermoanaerobaculia bacterium]